MILKLTADVKLATEDMHISYIDMINTDSQKYRITWLDCKCRFDENEDTVTFYMTCSDLKINDENATGKIGLLENTRPIYMQIHTNIHDVSDFCIDITKMEFIDNDKTYVIEKPSIYHHPIF